MPSVGVDVRGLWLQEESLPSPHRDARRSPAPRPTNRSSRLELELELIPRPTLDPVNLIGVVGGGPYPAVHDPSAGTVSLAALEEQRRGQDRRPARYYFHVVFLVSVCARPTPAGAASAEPSSAPWMPAR